jgi:ABC-type nickel/cobalt efflux system permease component RcnA
MLRGRRGIGRGVLLALGALVALPVAAGAHPLGNFSINRYTALRFAPGAVELRYIVDMAEIPTFQEIQESGMRAEPDHPSALAYAAQKAETLKEGLVLVVNGRRLRLETVSPTIIFPPGAGGLPTLKIGIRYRGRLDDARDLRVDYRDVNHAERAGWKEIIAIGGPELRITESSVPDRDRSHELSDYPTDLLQSPPQTVEAHVTVIHEGVGWAGAPAPGRHRPAARPAARVTTAPGREPAREQASVLSAPVTMSVPIPPTAGADGEALAVAPNRQTTPRNAFTELVATKQLGLGIILFALVVAAGFGAFHALEPGHGKTVVAAYLIGSRGTAWHALLLGLIVTASHTAGVYLLGGVTLYAQRYVVPERLYPWIGVLSGLTIAGLGFFLFLRHYAGGHAHHGQHHHHDHGDQPHSHHEHHEHHEHHRHQHLPESGEVSLKALFALGITGGIVPCPAALVVLLSALSLGRLAFGLVLITAFSLGLAMALIAIGLLMIYARRLMARFHGEGRLVTRWLPLASSAAMTLIGLAITLQALRAAGILEIRLT